MKKQLTLIGAVTGFSVMMIKLMFLTIEAAKFGSGFLALFIVLVSFFILAFILALLKVIKKGEFFIEYDKEIIYAVVILFSALIVYFFGVEFKLDKNITVGILALFFGIFFKKYALEATLGAFIGAGIYINTGYLGVIIVSLIVVFVRISFKGVFNGLGGKLGTIAFVGGLVAFIVLQESFGVGQAKNIADLIPVITVSLTSALLTFSINNELKLGPVTAYAIVLLLGSIFLLFEATKNLDLSTVVYGSALIGMSKKQECESYFVVILASIIFSLFALVGVSFINIGGRSGLLALISVIIAKEIYITIKKVPLGIKEEAY